MAPKLSIRSSSARRHQTQWAAQFAVASELCKQGYEVLFTAGHATPVADLVAISPKTKTPFLIDVKGLHRRNPWLIKRKERRAGLFYVLAYVPENQPNEFFVLTQEDVDKNIKSELHRLKRSNDYSVTGISWIQGLPHKDSWDALPK